MSRPASVSTSVSGELIARLKRKDEDALRELYDLYKQKVFSVGYSILRDAHLAEEALQDAFVKVYNKIGSYDASKNFEAWLNRIAVNAALDLWRKFRKNKDMLLDESDFNTVSYSREATEEAINKVWETLDQLPHDYRMVVILRDIQGFSGEEASQMLNLKHETLRWKLHKAREMFRQAWAQTQAKHDA